MSVIQKYMLSARVLTFTLSKFLHKRCRVIKATLSLHADLSIPRGKVHLSASTKHQPSD